MLPFRKLKVFCVTFWLAPLALLASDESSQKFLQPQLVHLRSGPHREWSEFPETPHGERLDFSFVATKNEREFTLRLRQRDVKQAWRVLLNNKLLGELVRDENDMAVYFPVPAGALVNGDNSVRIESAQRGMVTADDIRVGQVQLESRTTNEVLNEGTIEVTVVDGDTQQPLPCRLTIIDFNGSLQTTGSKSNEHLAVRPGTVYTANGRAQIGLPAGRFTIYAGRGFEYSLAQTAVMVVAGQTVSQKLEIRREVPTAGFVACDTHVHTLTHSGHGDATLTERLISIAGEGIELPIATDHNTHVDYEPLARQLQLRQYFTPVIGNEVTTSVGHFNVFPIQPGARVQDHKRTEWAAIFDDVFATPGVKIAILNHARDLHSGVRPFGPKLFNAVVSENLEGWPLRFNAMEVVNSGAMQTDGLRLFHDWMALLNRGYLVTPVGSSDSHDVGRHFVGQGRTYIRSDDRDLTNLDINAAVENFVRGRVMVSYGLLAELTVNEKYHSGDLAPVTADNVRLDLRVLGPHWVQASQLRLYANGSLVREEQLPPERDSRLPPGVKWQATWTIPKPSHDVHWVAIVVGPGIDGFFWKTAKPYQPTSSDWQPHTFGCSGAVWLDADADGQRTCARTYAERLFAAAAGELEKITPRLVEYDEATASQIAHLYRQAGGSLLSDEFQAAMKSAPPRTQIGFRNYLESWRENELAQTGR